MKSHKDILGSVDNQCPVGKVVGRWPTDMLGGRSSYSGKSGEEVAGEEGGRR